MEISVKLPESLYQNVSQLAEVKKKSIAEIIKNAVRKAVNEDSVDFEEQSKIIEQSIKFCTDKEVLNLATLQTPENQRLNYLFEKNRESVLTKKEQIELTKAVELSRINDLRKAFGIVEAKKRGLIK
jgi:metal-responsive CopG/Arc/MetJ family transcriptional regulator